MWIKDLNPGGVEETVIETLVTEAANRVYEGLEMSRDLIDDSISSLVEIHGLAESITQMVELLDSAMSMTITIDYGRFSIVAYAVDGTDSAHVHVMDHHDPTTPGVDGIRSIAKKTFEL